MKHEDVAHKQHVNYMQEEYIVLYVDNPATPIIITKPENKEMQPLSVQPDGWTVYDRALVELVKADEIRPWWSTLNPQCHCDNKVLASVGHENNCKWLEQHRRKQCTS